MKVRNWIFSRRGRAIILAAGVMMLLATVVLSAAIWSNHVPPAWDGASQAWKTSGDVVLDPTLQQDTVCFQTFSLGSNPQNNLVDCTLTPNGPANDYHYECTMPGSAVSDAFTVNYTLWAGSGTGCPTNSSLEKGPGGNFGPTGPNAVTLQTQNAEQPSSLPWLSIALLTVAAGAIGAGAFILKRKLG